MKNKNNYFRAAKARKRLGRWRQQPRATMALRAIARGRERDHDDAMYRISYRTF